MALAQGPVTPRRGYRRWHYAPSGSWDAERIAAAARSWARETGTPPRSWSTLATWRLRWSPGERRCGRQLVQAIDGTCGPCGGSGCWLVT